MSGKTRVSNAERVSDLGRVSHTGRDSNSASRLVPGVVAADAGTDTENASGQMDVPLGFREKGDIGGALDVQQHVRLFDVAML